MATCGDLNHDLHPPGECPVCQARKAIIRDADQEQRGRAAAIAPGMGAYQQLVIRAQADTDPARRQAAMTELAAIGPLAGTAAADTTASAVLARLYPQE